MKKITIAIDGFLLYREKYDCQSRSKKVQYIYVDTGAMYRAVTYHALEQGYIGRGFFKKEDLINDLDKLQLSFKFNDELGYAEIYLNGKNIEKNIRTLEVSEFVSQVSSVSEVRRVLVKQQQDLGKDDGIVMDGRDIGTVVFPNAELKIFMTASPEVRAKRRFDELVEGGNSEL